MKQCYLSFARQRFRNGQVAFNSPSRFLQDIDRRYFELSRPASGLSATRSVSTSGLSATRSVSVSGLTAEGGLYSPGDRVMHRVFGEGTVQRVYHDEVTENDKIEIAFDKQGTKTLLLTHAKLEKIE